MKKYFKKFAALALSAMMCASVLTGCGSQPTDESGSASGSVEAPAPSEVPVDVSVYKEAPMLTKLVDAGTLKKVDERIPNQDNIFIDTKDVNGKPLAIGNYGGSIRISNGKGGGGWSIARPVLESIIRYNNDGSYYPNVIKSYDVNADYTTWTFHLREGMKWSDGVDFTADDITFWYYMCHINNFDTKASWTALIDYKEGTGEFDDDGKEKMKNIYATVDKVDDYTVTFSFTQPKYPGDFIENGDFKFCWAPEHFLKDLIPASFYVENKYYANTNLSDEDAIKNAKAKGIEASDVKALGKNTVYYFWNTSGLPTLNSFVLSTKEGNNSNSSDICVLERNPYFWKVDAEGNQLPYVDEVDLVVTGEAADGKAELMFRSGELDFIEVGMQSINSITTDMKAKNLGLKRTEASSTNWGAYQVTFNYTCKDANYANLFANKDFRQAMSICVDRTEFSGLVADGFLEPGQAAPAAGNLGYSEAWEKKWTEYNKDEAIKLLEGCGLKKGSDGFFDFADGSDLVLVFQMYSGSGASESFAILKQYYEAIGIKCADSDLAVEKYDENVDNNDWYACLIPHMTIGGLSMKSRAAAFVPIQQAAEWYGDYGTYYAKAGAAGVAPTGDMAKLVEIYEKWQATPVATERDAYNLEICKIHEENLWSIAYLKAESGYSLVRDYVGNYPDVFVSDDLYQYGNMIHYWTLFRTDAK